MGIIRLNWKVIKFRRKIFNLGVLSLPNLPACRPARQFAPQDHNGENNRIGWAFYPMLAGCRWFHDRIWIKTILSHEFLFEESETKISFWIHMYSNCCSLALLSSQSMQNYQKNTRNYRWWFLRPGWLAGLAGWVSELVLLLGCRWAKFRTWIIFIVLVNLWVIFRTIFRRSATFMCQFLCWCDGLGLFERHGQCNVDRAHSIRF